MPVYPFYANIQKDFNNIQCRNLQKDQAGEKSGLIGCLSILSDSFLTIWINKKSLKFSVLVIETTEGFSQFSLIPSQFPLNENRKENHLESVKFRLLASLKSEKTGIG